MKIRLSSARVPYLIWALTTGALWTSHSFIPPSSGTARSLFTGILLLYVPLLYYIAAKKDIPFLKIRSPKRSIFWFVLLLTLTFIAYSTVLKATGNHFVKERLALLFTKKSALFWGTSLLAVGIPEEFFFRGFLYSEIEGSVAWKITISSILFMTTHITVHFSFLRLMTVIPGVALAVLRSRTDEVYTPALLHTFMNALNWAGPIL